MKLNKIIYFINPTHLTESLYSVSVTAETASPRFGRILVSAETIQSLSVLVSVSAKLKIAVSV